MSEKVVLCLKSFFRVSFELFGCFRQLLLEILSLVFACDNILILGSIVILSNFLVIQLIVSV